VTLLFIQGIAGFFVTIGIAVVMFKSNDILRKQTALKVFEFFLYGLVLSENLSIFSRIRLWFLSWALVSAGREKNLCAGWHLTRIHGPCGCCLLVVSKWWSSVPINHASSQVYSSFLACYFHHHGEWYVYCLQVIDIISTSDRLKMHFVLKKNL